MYMVVVTLIYGGNVTFRVLQKQGNVTRLLLFVFGSGSVVARNVTMLPNLGKLETIFLFVFCCLELICQSALE